MLVKRCYGYELEKAKPNTSEDFFNRSELVYKDGGDEKVFRVLYLRYFEECLQEFTPYEQNPLFKVEYEVKVGNLYTTESREVELKDIVALACYIRNPAYRNRKQVYINSKEQIAACFAGFDFEKLPALFKELETRKCSTLRSPLDYILQPI